MTGDDGVATVWAAAAVAVLTTVLAVCLHLGAALLGRHRAESAADLAALAAAQEAVRGEALACRRAAEIAASAGGAVVRCRLVGWSALVEVRVPVPFALPGLDVASGQAMAGPDPVGQPPVGKRSMDTGGRAGAAFRHSHPIRTAWRAAQRRKGALVVAAAPIGDAPWLSAPDPGLLEQVPGRFGWFGNRRTSLPRLRWGRSVA